MFPRLIPSAFAFLIALLLTPALHAQRGAITVPRNLVELTDASHVIVRGMVFSATAEPHPQFQNLKTLVIKVKVKETLKGAAPPVYTFRQFIWDIRDQFNAAGYRKGQELLLIMNRPSEVGLTSPVGLEQGRFRILRDRAGNKMAVNGHANAGLFSGMQAQLQARKLALSPAAGRIVGENRTALSSDELGQLIRELVGKQ